MFSNPFSMMLSCLKNVKDNTAALIVPRQACGARDTWFPNPVGHISIFGRHFSEPLNVPRCVSAGRVAMDIYRLWLEQNIGIHDIWWEGTKLKLLHQVFLPLYYGSLMSLLRFKSIGLNDEHLWRQKVQEHGLVFWFFLISWGKNINMLQFYCLKNIQGG